MAKQTLTVQLMHANQRIAALEAMVLSIDEIRSEQSARIAALEAQRATFSDALARERAAPRVIAPRPARVLPAHMVAARELAMRTGCVVKVQA